MKIVIINHTFQKEQFSKRWKTLAKDHKDWDVTLLAPDEFLWGDSKTLTFGFVEKKRGYEIDDGNFHVRTIRIKPGSKLITWTSKEMIDYIDENKPDIVYHIGSHTQESLLQILRYKAHRNKNLKVYAFSMRGPVSDLSNIRNLRKCDRNPIKKFLRSFQYVYFKYKIDMLNKYCDAVFCHYPDGMESFKKEGYKGPIFMQTQVGVDTEIFYPDVTKRQKIRNELKLGNSFVFASAVRFQPAKGIMKVLEAFPVDGDWKYLLMGSGNPEEVKAVENKIKEKHLEDKVILPGFVQWEDMAEYWNAADCAIHFTQSIPQWVETFSLSLVQAMATKLPVIGSDSGSVPYQIGPDGIIVNENDISLLHEKIQWMVNNPDEAKVIGERLYNRTINSFSVSHLNNMFYETVSDLQLGKLAEDKVDMASWRPDIEPRG